ncbi:hypothetical protein BDZ94DRAFT_1323531 [Collybia nuda]|uniref:Uncharacterized protein n=1 Tax=Collybia nuda TaxID=64659 RepID=A0A9P5Y4N1_9AGAR|nr:hypothetical protein BDZ94DRAFT_1323531 [Collybia nuda]
MYHRQYTQDLPYQLEVGQLVIVPVKNLGTRLLLKKLRLQTLLQMTSPKLLPHYYLGEVGQHYVWQILVLYFLALFVRKMDVLHF